MIVYKCNNYRFQNSIIDRWKKWNSAEFRNFPCGILRNSEASLEGYASEIPAKRIPQKDFELRVCGKRWLA